MDVYIAEAARTPFGSYFGSLSRVRADDLLATTIKGLLAKVPNLDPTTISDVVVGDSNGSGAEAIIQAGREIQTGDARFVVAGGVESMSRAPWIVKRTTKKDSRECLGRGTQPIDCRLANGQSGIPK